MMKLLTYILLILAAFSWQADLKSQTVMRISTTHFNRTRSYEVLTGERLVYKLKGDLFYKRDKIVAMGDSNIMLDNNGEIKLSQLKALRLSKNVHLVLTVQTVFFMGAVMFVSFNTINNMITDTSPVFDPTAAYVSAGLLGAGLLIRELGLKRVKVNKHTDLKILPLDFQHLGPDSTSAAK